jgi:hypothetical protein
VAGGGGSRRGGRGRIIGGGRGGGELSLLKSMLDSGLRPIIICPNTVIITRFSKLSALKLVGSLNLMVLLIARDRVQHRWKSEAHQQT